MQGWRAYMHECMRDIYSISVYAIFSYIPSSPRITSWRITQPCQPAAGSKVVGRHLVLLGHITRCCADVHKIPLNETDPACHWCVAG